MLIVPELHAVLINPPRTGSRALIKAIKTKHPHAFHLYSHREADGVPAGYDRFTRYGVFRHPLDRLQSLYNYIKNNISDRHEPNWLRANRDSTRQPFEEWLVNNEILFTDPYGRNGDINTFNPFYSVGMALPENRKSQYHYLRPDLGTILLDFNRLDFIAGIFDVKKELVQENASTGEKQPLVNGFARAHLQRFFAWDLAVHTYMTDCCGGPLIHGAELEYQFKERGLITPDVHTIAKEN